MTFAVKDLIGPKANVHLNSGSYAFSNLTNANANTTLANAFSFTAFTTYPISSVIVGNHGVGINAAPNIQAVSMYTTDVPGIQTNLANLGILAPIQILQSGSGYSNGDSILFVGGSGYGANANVSLVSSSGSILTVGYTANSTTKVSLGGMGYNYGLPIPVIKHVATGNLTSSLTSNVVNGNGTTFTSQFVPGAYVVTNNKLHFFFQAEDGIRDGQ